MVRIWLPPSGHSRGLLINYSGRFLNELDPQNLGIPNNPVWRWRRVPALRGHIDDPILLARRTAPGRARGGPEQPFIQRLADDRAGEGGGRLVRLPFRLYRKAIRRRPPPMLLILSIFLLAIVLLYIVYKPPAFVISQLRYR